MWNVSSCNKYLSRKLIRKRGVVGLELDGGGRGAHRGRDEAECLAGDRVGVRVDGRDGGADRHREVRGELGHGHVVKNYRPQVTRALGRAAERGELLLLEHVLERRLGRLPLALGLAEAQVAERRADVDGDRSANWVLWVGHGKGVVLGEGRVGLLGGGDGGRDVANGGTLGGGGRRGDLEVGHGGGGLGLVGADGHCACVWCRVE